jgi:hypothetical protein
VAGGETNGRKHQAFDALSVQAADSLIHIGFEPRLPRRAAAALLDQPPVGAAQLFGNQAAGFQ